MLAQTPYGGEVRACRPWLDAELAAGRPRVVAALGATAAKASFGSGFRVTARRRRAVATPLADVGFATVHPSAVLRTPGGKRAAERPFTSDLARVARWLSDHPA